MNTTNAQLIDHLVSEGVLQRPELIAALETVDRKEFVLPEMVDEAYHDEALSIGFEQTISQPFTVAFMLELLAPQKGERILDVGSGSGWTTALLAELVGPAGRVYGVERIPELVAFGQGNLAKYDYKNAEIRAAGEELGLPAEAPFDRILVSAAAAKLPQPLVEQLKTGGTMVVPVGDAVWKVVKRADGSVESERYGSFAFVPLVHYSM